MTHASYCGTDVGKSVPPDMYSTGTLRTRLNRASEDSKNGTPKCCDVVT